MSTKKNSIASQALLDMDAITSAIKEESKKSLNALLTEAVKNALREGCNEEDEDYEVIDDENKEDKTSDKKEMNSKKEENEVEDQEVIVDDEKQSEEPSNDQQPVQVPNNAMSQDVVDGNGDEGWNEFSNYQVGDGNTYDLTGENDYETVVKVYKLLNDDDQVVVKKEGNTINIQDNEANTEYVIDLGDNSETTEEMTGGEMPDGLNESLLDGLDVTEHEGEFVDDVPFEDEDEYIDDQDVIGHDEDDPFIYGDYEDYRSDDLGDFDETEMAGFDDELYEGKIKNNKKARKPMKESKEVLFEVDLGYTDDYQDKDPIAGLSNNEPSKSGKSWHKGVPTGTEKPWAGETKSKGDPFKETQKVQGSVNEEDEMTDEIPMDEQVAGAVKDRAKGAKTKVPNNPGKHGASAVKNNASVEADYIGKMDESKELKSIKNENKELKKAILELRKSLNEAYITNINLGKITKLFLENTTSQAEKIDIVNRFSNEAKTVEQSNTLYESINKQLKKKQQININESSVTANGTKELNEQKIYKSPDLMKTIDLMGRVLDC